MYHVYGLVCVSHSENFLYEWNSFRAGPLDFGGGGVEDFVKVTFYPPTCKNKIFVKTPTLKKITHPFLN